MEQSLATIEQKYGDGLLEAGAITSKPPAIHDVPEMITPSQDSGVGEKEKGKEKGKASSSKKPEAAEVMRSGPITLSADGDAQGSSPQAACPQASSAQAACPVASGAPQAVQAYAVEQTQCTMVPFPALEDYGSKLFLMMGEEHLLSAFVFAAASVTEHIQVGRVEASDPMIWMARATKDCPPDALTLVPWAPSLMRIVADPKAYPDGVALESFRRPRHHFGGLPLLATLRMQCPSLGDTENLVARSPLTGKFPGNVAPSAFWCVLEAGEGDEGRVNMEVRVAEMQFTTTPPKVDQTPKKKMKPLDLLFTFPVLVNTRPLKQGDTLVFPRGTEFHLAAPSEEEVVPPQAMCVQEFPLT